MNAGDYYTDVYSTFVTNIAGYSEGSDGYTLIDAEDTTRRSDYDVQELDVDGDTDLDARLLYSDVDGGRVQTTTQTQYYLVIKDIDKYGMFVDTVLTWTGYANVPEDAALATWGTAAYAVTHEGTADYDVADVVVFETFDTADHNTYFVYNANNASIEYIWALGYDDEGNIVDDRMDVDELLWGNGVIEFYEIYDNASAFQISEDYADHNVYAGIVSVEYDVSGKDYIQVDDTAAGFLRFDPAKITIYKVVEDDIGYYNYNIGVVDDWDEIKADDHMILFTDDDENVEYAIWVEGSVDDDDLLINDVRDLWWSIWNDAHPYPELTVVDNIDHVTAAPTVAYSDLTETYTITVTPDTGYEFTADTLTQTWTVGNGTISSSVNAGSIVYTVTGLDKASTLVLTGAATPIEYTITCYDVNGDELTTLADTYTIESGATLADVPAVPGKTAAGWNTEADGTGTAYASGAAIAVGAYGDLELYAQYDDNAYTLTVRFVEADGSIADDTITVPGLKYNEKYSFEIPAVKGQVPTIDGAYVTAGDEYEVTVTATTTVVVKYVDTVALTVNPYTEHGWDIDLKDTSIDEVSAAGETLTFHAQNDVWGTDQSAQFPCLVTISVQNAEADTTYRFTCTANAATGADFTVTLSDVTADVIITVENVEQTV